MKKLVLLLLVAFAILASCAKDIIIAQQSELRGAYTGLYKYVINYEVGGISPITSEQYVDWTFTDQKFYCNVNDSINNQWLCNVSGNYKLENVLVFSDTLLGAQTCDRDRVPIGNFQLIRYQDNEGKIDSLKITQEDFADHIAKLLMLYPSD
ncbi:MAG: hypothetical protein CVT49_04715 [candidate division Zixibacteria bacterium HGW-Zixibacteria-1]|nr:MAG: hypothetical protein CVT49_04715 [candidate division Zixibacteria bacterium HGW-Zixibacteria-1]